MTNEKGFKTKKRKLLGASLVIASLCSGMNVFAADFISASAPITYKGYNPQTAPYSAPIMPQYEQQATRQVPNILSTVPQPPSRLAPYRSGPQQTQQHAPIQPMTTPLHPVPHGPVFDVSKVDQTLYKHQRIGKPYTVAGQTYKPAHNPKYDAVGTASWYGDKFHGKPTALGEPYDKNAMTAAHKTLPLNSYVVVTNLDTGKSLKVRINDRGPFIGGRIIDLSEAAASILGVKTRGLGRVRVQYAGPSEPKASGKSFQQAERPTLQPRKAPPAKPYMPLRKHAKPNPYEAPHTQMPQIQVPPVMAPAPTQVFPQLSLPAAPRPIPEASLNDRTDDGGVVTLTIKGPIHMASSKNSDPKPKFYKNGNRTSYPTKK